MPLIISTFTKTGQLEEWLARTDLSQLKAPESQVLEDLDQKVYDFLKTRTTLLAQMYPNDVSELVFGSWS